MRPHSYQTQTGFESALDPLGLEPRFANSTMDAADNAPMGGARRSLQVNAESSWAHSLKWYALALFVGACVGFGYCFQRIVWRQDSMESLEDAGAELRGHSVGDKSETSASLEVGWLVQSAEYLHGRIGIGKPQRAVHSIRAEGDRFGDEHVSQLLEVHELRHLYLKGSRVTDLGMNGISRLRELRTIDLSCTAVSDRSLEWLAQCESLRKLTVNETAISRPAIERFRSDRPEIAVQWSPETSAERRAAIGALLTSGGQLVYDTYRRSQQGDESATVVIRGRWSRNINHKEQAECLKHAAEIPEMRSLWLQTLSLTNPEIEMLRRLTGVRSLRLDRVWARDFSWLASLSSLESLSVGASVEVDEVLRHVCELPQLRSITAERVTDQGGHHIGRAGNLVTVWLRSSTVGDVSIRSWQRLNQLERLIIDSSHVTDASLTTIGNLSRLTRLELNGGQISDRGLPHLWPLTELRSLGLRNTKVSPAGFVELIPLHLLRQLRYSSRGERGQVDVADYIMDSLWDDFPRATREELRRRIARLSAMLPDSQEYSLGGRKIDIAEPDEWMDELLDHLEPVLQFRKALPDCRLR